MIMSYDGKPFKSIADEDVASGDSPEPDQTQKDMLGFVKDALAGKVKDVRLSKRLKMRRYVFRLKVNYPLRWKRF